MPKAVFRDALRPRQPQLLCKFGSSICSIWLIFCYRSLALLDDLFCNKVEGGLWSFKKDLIILIGQNWVEGTWSVSRRSYGRQFVLRGECECTHVSPSVARHFLFECPGLLDLQQYDVVGQQGAAIESARRNRATAKEKYVIEFYVQVQKVKVF